MLIEAPAKVEQSMTKIALPALSVWVVRKIVSFVLCRAMPADQFLGDDVARIFAPDKLVQLITADTRSVWA